METLGEFLKNERDKKEVAISKIAKQTNINPKLLDALEKNDFREIPGRFYLLNFIRSYLNALEVDADAFIKKHQSVINGIHLRQEEHLNNYYSKLKYSRFKKRNIFFTLFVTLTLALLAFYLFHLYNPKLKSFFGLNTKRYPIPQTGIFLLEHFKVYCLDFSPLVYEIILSKPCWIKIDRGEENVPGRLYGKGERLNGRAYEMTIRLGDASAIESLKINGKKLVEFTGAVGPRYIKINPQNIADLTK